MPVAIHEISADLSDETSDLLGLVAPLTADDWDRPTPAEGWSIRDQLSHLAFFDDAAVRALTDPDAFRAEAADAVAGGPDFVDRATVEARSLPGRKVLAWFLSSRGALLDVYRHQPPEVRIPWYGPDMSVASALTARLMETWAHGQDVADALGTERTPTARLRHIAHLGVATRRHSYRLRDRPVPIAPVHVALTAPDGDTWSWGDPDAPDRVTGPALDFALVVTQRRHLDATALAATAVAREWLEIAQAYAGAPGPGRPA